MFDYVSGKVARVTENKIVIDCGGVGFSLTASAFTCAQVCQKTEATLPVYLAVREDALELFGFGSEAEREMFLLLIGVSGVGPKLAIAVLGGMNEARLRSVIASGDAAALSTVKGVGKKTAERIVLELKGKVETADIPVGEKTAISVVDEQAVLALISLGYERKEADAAVKKAATDGMTTEQIVRAALRNL